ncbi:MAG TPA: hypothetical protein VFM61_05680 [Pseudidiomarina sp.]|nr:hypothetical protein [Pseudidiomarina sp.]
MKSKHQQGYFLPLAVLFAGILTLTWVQQFQPSDDTADWHEASRVLDEILFWQQAAIYYRIDFGEWPISLTEVETSMNIPWLPNYLSGSRRIDHFVIEYESDRSEVIAKLPVALEIGLEQVDKHRFQLSLFDSELLEPNSELLLRDGSIQEMSVSIDVNQHNFAGIRQLEGRALATRQGFSLVGNFTTTRPVELNAIGITANDMVINGRSFNSDVRQLLSLYAAVQHCIEVTRYCL